MRRYVFHQHRFANETWKQTYRVNVSQSVSAISKWQSGIIIAANGKEGAWVLLQHNRFSVLNIGFVSRNCLNAIVGTQCTVDCTHVSTLGMHLDNIDQVGNLWRNKSSLFSTNYPTRTLHSPMSTLDLDPVQKWMGSQIDQGCSSAHWMDLQALCCILWRCCSKHYEYYVSRPGCGKPFYCCIDSSDSLIEAHESDWNLLERKPLKRVMHRKSHDFIQGC